VKLRNFITVLLITQSTPVAAYVPIINKYPLEAGKYVACGQLASMKGDFKMQVTMRSEARERFSKIMKPFKMAIHIKEISDEVKKGVKVRASVSGKSRKSVAQKAYNRECIGLSIKAAVTK